MCLILNVVAMKHLMNPLLAVLFVISLNASALPTTADKGQLWIGEHRNNWTQSNSVKVLNDFGASLLVTPDQNWRQKWETPSDQMVYLDEAEVVRLGEKLWVLAFMVNPKLDDNGQANVVCALTIVRPDQSIAFDQGGIPCLQGAVEGNLDNVRLSPVVVEYLGEEGDPLGRWTIRMRIKDENRDTQLDLETSFTLVSD